MSSDAELLEAFLAHRSENAFRALVERHLPLVYSAARRQLGNAQLAEDVAQVVFALFARKAGALRGHPALTGWLYTTTHHAAAKVWRAERRRSQRERDAFTMTLHEAGNDSSGIDRDLLRPVIDEALIELKAADRLAVLLRFFENRSYAEIGGQLNLGENTARMRVDRALERLRVALGRRGIRSTAAALEIALATQATCAVPAGLGGSIAAFALSTPAASGFLFLMSTTFVKNAAMAVALIAATTGLFFQHRELAQLRAENARLAHAAVTAQKPAEVQPRTASDGNAGGNAELARLRAQVERLKSTPENSWQQRVELLKELLQQLPEEYIPEISLASDDDWLDAAKHKLETTDDYRQALARLRDLSVGKFIGLLHPAVMAYRSEHGGQFPADISAVQPYVDRKLDDAIWHRYVVTTADTVGNVRMGGDLIITETSVVDPTYDNEFVIGPNGYGSSSYGVSTTMALRKAYKQDNGGYPNDLAQLQSYATTPRQKAALAAAIERQQANKIEPKN